VGDGDALADAGGAQLLPLEQGFEQTLSVDLLPEGERPAELRQHALGGLAAEVGDDRLCP